MGSLLRDVTSVRLPQAVIHETLSALQLYGRRQCEGFVLWVGAVRGAAAEIQRALVPPQRSLQSEEGVGYFIEGDTLFALNRFLSDSKLRLIAQVHSHPSRAYHSSTDDRYAIATAAGSLSLVVPNFGFAPTDLGKWAVYRLVNAKWRELSSRDVQRLIELE